MSLSHSKSKRISRSQNTVSRSAQSSAQGNKANGKILRRILVIDQVEFEFLDRDTSMPHRCLISFIITYNEWFQPQHTQITASTLSKSNSSPCCNALLQATQVATDSIYIKKTAMKKLGVDELFLEMALRINIWDSITPSNQYKREFIEWQTSTKGEVISLSIQII